MDISHFITINLICIAVIIIWFMVKNQENDIKVDHASITCIFLALWIIVAGVFNVHFLVYRPPTFPDITVERLMFLFIIFILIAGLFTGKVNLRTNITIELIMGIFVTICIISMMRTGFLPISPEFVSPWFVFITGYFFPFIMFVFAKSFVLNEKDIMFILHGLFYFGIYLSITAFFEFADLRQFVFPGYINDPQISSLHLERARGPFLNSAFNGVAILIGFICGLHLLQKKEGLTGFFHKLGLLLFFPAVFCTLTRSVYLGLIITLLIFLRWYKTSFPKWKLISLPIVVVLIFGIINYPRLLSEDRRKGGVVQVVEIDIRFALLERSYFLFAERPLTGVGMAQFIPSSTLAYRGPVPYVAEVAGTQFQHNHLLGVATELGIFGILTYLAIVIIIMRRMVQLSGKLPETGVMGNNFRITVFAIWSVYLTNNLFVEPSNNLFINAVPFIFAGVMDGLYTRSLQTGLAAQHQLRIKTAHA